MAKHREATPCQFWVKFKLDLSVNQFDDSLLKYKPKTLGTQATELSCPELFERYLKHKIERGLSNGAQRRYSGVLSHLRRSLNISAHHVNNYKAGNFAAVLQESVSNRTAKDYLWVLNGCWEWAAGKYQVSDRPLWSELTRDIKVNDRKEVQPFNPAEIKAILHGFKTSRYYAIYYPYVFAMFHIAARPGELAALTWNDVASDFSNINIRASFSRGTRRNQTKTGRSRLVFCNSAFQELVRSLHSDRKPKKSELLFSTPKGHPIDDHRFRRRGWTKVLESFGAAYRGLYYYRHSSISLATLNGANLIELSEKTGYSKRMMMQTYLYAVEKKALFLEF
jgi:integrase